MRNFLKKLVENSQRAINDGIYEINENLEKSKIDLFVGCCCSAFWWIKIL